MHVLRVLSCGRDWPKTAVACSGLRGAFPDVGKEDTIMGSTRGILFGQISILSFFDLTLLAADRQLMQPQPKDFRKRHKTTNIGPPK